LKNRFLKDMTASGKTEPEKHSALKREKQMKQRGSAPHLPIRNYCPHPSNH